MAYGRTMSPRKAMAMGKGYKKSSMMKKNDMGAGGQSTTTWSRINKNYKKKM